MILYYITISIKNKPGEAGVVFAQKTGAGNVTAPPVTAAFGL